MQNLMAISDVRSHLPVLVKKVSQTLERVLITVKGEPKAAILSLEELDSLEETAEVLSIPGSWTSIKRGLEQAKKRRGLPLSKI